MQGEHMPQPHGIGDLQYPELGTGMPYETRSAGVAALVDEPIAPRTPLRYWMRPVSTPTGTAPGR